MRSHNWYWFAAAGLMLSVVSACSPAQLMIRPVAQSGPGEELPLRNEVLSRVEIVGKPELYDTPWDATPDPDGNIIYFTATGSAGSGVYRVAAEGGESIEVAVGEPFATPLGLAMSTDGEIVYVADAEAGGEGGSGRIFVVPVAGGEVTIVAGTEGTAPRGVEVASEDGSDVVYFSGVDPTDGQAAVMKIGAAGGSLNVVAKGAPLVEPGGLAIRQDGVVYVADRSAAGNDLGSVFRIEGTNIETIAENFRAGTPVVGATLTLDEGALLVSALAPNRDSAQVLLILLPSLERGIVNKVIAANSGSGGVHRAHNVNVFAWADSKRGRSTGRSESQGGLEPGGVYVLQ